MTRPHGGNREFLVGEDLFVESPQFAKGRRTDKVGVTIAAAAPKPDEPRFSYGRMFRQPYLPEFRPESEGLIALGESMAESKSGPHTAGIPAGYVYFGQFVDHDLSFDENAEHLPDGAVKPEDQYSLRSPSLDLDSLYGYDVLRTKQSTLGRRVYADDGVSLRVSETQPESSKLVLDRFPVADKAFPNDLPRKANCEKKQLAAIIDPRNDENLALAQTHLAFIKFHNAVVKQLSGTVLTGLFEAARETVVRHYQWIILHDFLPKIIEPEVLNDVVKKGCQHLSFDNEPFMPVEFSAAAFRLGHALVSETYEWNAVFQSPPKGIQPAHLFKDLFTFTGFGSANLLGQNNLPSSWIIDWTRFYDFEGFDGINGAKILNFARKIGPSVASSLMQLPLMPGETDERLQKLPVRTLLRGRLLGLPSGQCVARRLGVAEISARALPRGFHTEVLEGFGLHKFTPLWYYILREAEVFHEGERLGPVGSRIVAETFVALIKKSRISILPKEEPGEPIWKPDLGRKAGEFSMPELFYFVHRVFPDENFINPLGD